MCTERWKYVAFEDFRPMLFDLENDSNELTDLGGDAAYAQVCDEMQAHLMQWMLRRSKRADMSPKQIADIADGANREKRGILIGFWDEDALPEEVKKMRVKSEE